MKTEEKVEVVREFLEGWGERVIATPGRGLGAKAAVMSVLAGLVAMRDESIAQILSEGTAIRATQRGGG